MASHGSDTNKIHLFMSFPSFFFLCLSVCLSVFLPVLQHRSFINEFSFVFLSFLYVCLSNKGHLLMSFPSFFLLFCLCACLCVCQKKGHLLISFPSFFFLFCLCVCLSVCLSNKGHLLMVFPSFRSARCVCVWGGGYSHIRAVRVCAARKPPIGLPGVCVRGGGGTPILGQYGYVPPESPPIFRPGPLLKTPRFRPGLHRKGPPFSKIYICLFHFSDMGCSKRPRF